MGIKERTFIKANRANARLEQKEQSSSWHSSYYHRYFEGWTEITEPKPSGRGVRIKRVYTGEYYKADMSPRERRIHKMISAVLVLLSVVLYVRACYMSLESNVVWYVVFPEFMALCGCIFLVWFLISKLTAPELLKIREYREGMKNLKLAGAVQAIFLALTSLNTLLHFFLNSGDSGEIFAAVMFLAASAAAFGVYLMEKKVKYNRISNENASMDGHRIE